MTRVNLLPWREKQRKRQQQNFLILLGSASVLSLIILLTIHWRIAEQIDHQQQRNQRLNDEIARLNRKIKQINDLDKKKQDLMARMEIIHKLQTSRPAVVHLFDALTHSVPEGVELMDLTQVNHTITINGIAQSNARVSVFMRNLDQSQWFQDALLKVIETKIEKQGGKDRLISRFALQVTQTEGSLPLAKEPKKSR